MIKISSLHVLLTIAMVGTVISAPAESQSPPASQSTDANKAIYAPVPTAQERLLDTKNYVRFPGWNNIDIVKEGVVDQGLSQQIEANRWNEDVLLSKLKWLQIRDFDIKLSQILAPPNSHLVIIVPFAIGVRYQENGNISSAFAQGTINAEGMIILTFQNGTFLDLRIEQYDDSQESERLGRKLGIIDQYDAEFINGVVPRLLKNYLSELKSQESLIKLIEQRIQFPPSAGRFTAG